MSVLSIFVSLSAHPVWVFRKEIQLSTWMAQLMNGAMKNKIYFTHWFITLTDLIKPCFNFTSLEVKSYKKGANNSLHSKSSIWLFGYFSYLNFTFCRLTYILLTYQLLIQIFAYMLTFNVFVYHFDCAASKLMNWV